MYYLLINPISKERSKSRGPVSLKVMPLLSSMKILALQTKHIELRYWVNATKVELTRALIAFVAAVALMTGCATSGNENAATVHNTPALGGPNGSISPANPFGVGLGRGLNPAN